MLNRMAQSELRLVKPFDSDFLLPLLICCNLREHQQSCIALTATVKQHHTADEENNTKQFLFMSFSSPKFFNLNWKTSNKFFCFFVFFGCRRYKKFPSCRFVSFCPDSGNRRRQHAAVVFCRSFLFSDMNCSKQERLALIKKHDEPSLLHNSS